MPRGWRSNNGPPSSSSSARSDRVSGGCETLRRCAARVTFSSSATATKYRIWSRLIPNQYWTLLRRLGQEIEVVERYGPQHLPALRHAGRLAAATLAEIGRRLRPGITTLEI